MRRLCAVHGLQAVTRHILTVGQELTFAKERIALLDDDPRAQGSSPTAPQPVLHSALTELGLSKRAATAHGCMTVVNHASIGRSSVLSGVPCTCCNRNILPDLPPLPMHCSD